MSYSKALRQIRSKYKVTEEKKENSLVCQFCSVSYNVAAKYKVLKCNKSENFRHSFISFAKYAQLRKDKHV